MVEATAEVAEAVVVACGGYCGGSGYGTSIFNGNGATASGFLTGSNRFNLTGSQQTWEKQYLDKTCYLISHFSVPYERSCQELSADSRILSIG